MTVVARVKRVHGGVRTRSATTTSPRGVRAESERGFALWELPVGFVRSEEGRIEKTPDRQVQQAISNVFQKFQQLGSARQATIWFREERISVPHVKPGTAGREVTWTLPSSGRIRQMLKNPCYGGAFAYGKT